MIREPMTVNDLGHAFQVVRANGTVAATFHANPYVYRSAALAQHAAHVFAAAQSGAQMGLAA